MESLPIDSTLDRLKYSLDRMIRHDKFLFGGTHPTNIETLKYLKKVPPWVMSENLIRLALKQAKDAAHKPPDWAFSEDREFYCPFCHGSDVGHYSHCQQDLIVSILENLLTES